MDERDKFTLFHEYHRLARAGCVPFFYCQHCGCQLVTSLGKEDKLALWCVSCDSKLYPGLGTIEMVKARVQEWIL